jgi:hypothetical protein
MRPALVCLASLALACMPRASVPDAERRRVEQELGGAQRWLGVAVHVGPFFGDGSKLLASDQPFEELELLEGPSGKVIAPPPPERVLPPGTPVRIARVEFPTGWIIAKRIVMTPRYHPWVFLQVAGESRPVVLVLPQELTTFEEVRLELDRWLAATDPSPALRALPAEHQAHVATKRLVEDMAPRAVEMAWGYPERKVIDRPAGTEEWTWPTARRRASFKDGRLVRWTARAAG